MNLATNQIRPVSRFASRNYQALGAYDGTALIWKEFHSLTDLDDFSVMKWSARTGKVLHVGGSHRDPATGTMYPSPWAPPALGDGSAAWVEGTDASGGGRLIVLDTASNRTRLFSTGHPGGALLIYGHALIWGESTKPGALTSVFAKSLTNGRRVTPPFALRSQHGGSSFATDGTAIAWVGPDQDSLY